MPLLGPSAGRDAPPLAGELPQPQRGEHDDGGGGRHEGGLQHDVGVRPVGTAASLTGAGLQAIAWSMRQLRAERDEMAAHPAVLERAQALTGMGGTPLVVVTATAGDHPAGWPAGRPGSPDGALPISSHRLWPATHISLFVDASDSAFGVAAIDDVVQAVRTRTAVPDS